LISCNATADSFSAANLKGWLDIVAAGGFDASDREVEMIEAAMADCHGRISGTSGAAAKLGNPWQTLESKIRCLGINKYGLNRPSS
jgi:DNA-binding NtrC family response regulator